VSRIAARAHLDAAQIGIGEDWRDGVSEASCDETVQHDGDGTGR